MAFKSSPAIMHSHGQNNQQVENANIETMQNNNNSGERQDSANNHFGFADNDGTLTGRTESNDNNDINELQLKDARKS